MSFFNLIFAHKLLTFFILASVGLCISTIILGVNVTHLKSELDEERENQRISTTDATSVDSTTAEIVTSTESPVIDMSKFRLPTAVKPVLYELFLYPNLKTGLFKGTVTISLNVIESIKDIVLHTKGLNITNVAVKGEETNFKIDDKYEILMISRKEGTNFTSSFDKLSIEFNGDMKNRIVGLYTSSYKSQDTITNKGNNCFGFSLIELIKRSGDICFGTLYLSQTLKRMRLLLLNGSEPKLGLYVVQIIIENMLYL